jgi:hypothetical protein
MNARVKPCIDLAEAYEITRIAFPPLTTPVAERDPEIDAARAIEAREDSRREADEYE